MILIDNEKCVGCGLCVRDCFQDAIRIVEGQAKFVKKICMQCGHCIAICPKGAVSTDEYNMKDVKEYDEAQFKIEPGTLLNFIQFRRTVRQFKNKAVETEKILKIIEAGRFTQTGSNSQNVSYIVVRDNIEELKKIALESLNEKGEDILKNLNPQTIPSKRYAQMWIKMYEEYKENPEAKDKLFFNAPVLVLTICDSQVNAALASSNMELMTNALGLGTFFSGFFTMAAKGNEKIRNIIGLEEGKEIVTSMIIGYPDVKYVRTVPRKEASILWK